MFRILCLLSLLYSANAFKCFSCDTPKTCSDPFTAPCPETSKCYTLKLRANDEVTQKGCAHNCSAITLGTKEICQECDHDLCNRKKPWMRFNTGETYSNYENGKQEITKEEMEKREYFGHGFLTSPPVPRAATTVYFTLSQFVIPLTLFCSV